MRLDFENFTDKFAPYFVGESWEKIAEYFDSLEFKYEKSIYHFDKIKSKINESEDFGQFDYYEKILNPIYFELESFLISIRSSVDIVMHIINTSLDLRLSNDNVYIGSIYKSSDLPKTIKNVLHKYTHNRDKQIWNFIYSFRNQVVHEKSINQSLPLSLDFFHGPKPLAYFEFNGKQNNVVTFLESSIGFIERFITNLFEAIVSVKEYNSRK